MKMHSPIAAMLWENWRLTRIEAAQRLALGLVAGSAALVLLGAGATFAFWILITLHGMFVWLSILKLNGGKFMDGYKPGFPFYLLYTRPVPTAVFVSVAMLYDAVSCTALYLVSAVILGFAFGQPLPLWSVVLWSVTFHLCYTCIQWSTSSRVVQWVGSMAFSLPLFFLLKFRVSPSLQVQFSFVENAAMVLVCVVVIALTIAGVARQRRGDIVSSEPRTAASGYPTWMVNLVRIPCPTSSATRAQVWFELRSSGLPVLAIGFGIAMSVALLFALGVPLPPVRYAAILIAAVAIPITLLNLGGNAFGIRRKQGRTYASAFEATQPYGTAQMAGVKVLVRTACVLFALTAIGTSVWASSSFVSEWGEWLVDGKKDANQAFLQLRDRIAGIFGGQSGFMHAWQAVLATLAIAATVAAQAVREALKARYPRRLLAGVALLMFVYFAMILLKVGGHKGFVSAALAGAVFNATFWIAAAVMVLATIYLLWSGFADRILTIRYLCGAILIPVVFVASSLAGIPTAHLSAMLWLALLILTIGLLAPWSLHRIRHL